MARKDAYIIIRVEKKFKKDLEKLAGGVRRLSKFIREILEAKI